MARTSINWTRAAAVLLAGVFALHLWRAASTSLTTDEAFTYQSFVTPPLEQVLTTYDANHHVLNSLLMKLACAMLGTSELALRVPALLGALLYLVCIWALARRCFRDTPLMFAACALLSLHCGLLDYFSLARGYSLAMGCLAWALLEAEAGAWRRVSFALGLAVAANAAFAVPAAALVAALLLVKRLWRELDSLVVPGVTVALVLVALPFSRAAAGNFYYGASTLRESLESLLGAPDWPRLSVLLLIAVPLLVAAGAWRDRGVWSVTLGLCLAALVLLHGLLKMPWPRGRTGLYLLPPALLLVARLGARWRWGALVPAVLASACAVTMTPGFFREWRFDADNREVAALLARDYPNARVAVAHPLTFGLGYYRAVLPLKPGTQADVYVLRDGGGEARPQGARTIRRFPRSGLQILVAER